jgi:hypothetical protein
VSGFAYSVLEYGYQNLGSVREVKALGILRSLANPTVDFHLLLRDPMGVITAEISAVCLNTDQILVGLMSHKMESTAFADYDKFVVQVQSTSVDAHIARKLASKTARRRSE